MFRKIVCMVSAAGILFGMVLSAAAEGQVIQGAGYAVCLTEQPYFGAQGNILAMELATEGRELPDTGDYPAPIFTAMGISLLVVVLMVLTENRKK